MCPLFGTFSIINSDHTSNDTTVSYLTTQALHTGSLEENAFDAYRKYHVALVISVIGLANGTWY